MTRIQETFARLRREGRTALMPYLTVGFPERDSALELVPALVEGGADLIELGVPFSDPLADGATIQAAGQRALANGMTLARCLDQAAQLAPAVAAPLVLMGYYNPILQMGVEAFARRAAASGVAAAIVPDLPPGESDALRTALRAHDIDLVFLLAPTSDEARIREVTARGSGFQYLVSLTGVTGARAHLPPGLDDLVVRVRRATDLPLAVGFGISTPAQAARVAQVADGVIVGSALIRAIAAAEAEGGPSTAAGAARAFVAALRAGIDAGAPAGGQA
jgi:tryptophan synthase alpha chain